MICNNCGHQIADNSAFCINCGQKASYLPAPQEPDCDENFNNALRYIEIADSILVPAIIVFILANVLPVIGDIIVLARRKFIKNKLAELPAVDKTTLDPETLGRYKKAHTKVTVSKILSIVAFILSIIMVIMMVVFAVVILLAIVVVVLIVLAILIAVGFF